MLGLKRETLGSNISSSVTQPFWTSMSYLYSDVNSRTSDAWPIPTTPLEHGPQQYAQEETSKHQTVKITGVGPKPTHLQRQGLSTADPHTSQDLGHPRVQSQVKNHGTPGGGLSPFPRKTFLQAALPVVEKEVSMDKQLQDSFTIHFLLKSVGKPMLHAMLSSLKVVLVHDTRVFSPLPSSAISLPPMQFQQPHTAPLLVIVYSICIFSL